MLNDDRKYYVTASQAHRVMAGFESELAGREILEPETPDLLSWIDENGIKPKVTPLKDIGIIATGKEIEAAWKYLQAQTVVFSDGMESVAREIAMTSFIRQRDEGFKSKDMERGNNQEGEAVAALSAKTGVEFTATEENQQFLTLGNLGVTPDGVELDGFEYKSCAEVKNPKDTTHMKYLSEIRDTESFLSVVPEYYWQAQTGLHVTGADVYHWASFHNGYDGKYQLVYLPIKPNKKHIEMLVERADRVLARVPEIVESIKANYGS